MTCPVMICAAPNGGRKTKLDHPNLPMTATELAHTAAECFEQGASMLHMHIRDNQGLHTLDTDLYKSALKNVRRAVGPDMIIQITTESVGKYTSDQQMEVVRQVKPEAVSIALRELCPSQHEESPAGEFFRWMMRESISPQYILYSPDDVKRFNYLRQIGVIPGDEVAVLLVLGAYHQSIHADPNDVLPMKNRLTKQTIWSACAFGGRELECVLRAANLGGHVRVGFENNLLLANGERSLANGQLVRQVRESLDVGGHRIATSIQARNLLNMLQ